jgi:hypothetical protein
MHAVSQVDMCANACEGAGMDTRPEPPPEGRLIADALTLSGLSIRQASKRAGISYGRWRQIATGYQNVSHGSFARVRAPALTLARMASAVSVTPERLEEAGRGDAAEALREILGRDEPEQAAPDLKVPDLQEMTAEERRAVLALLAGFRAPESAQRGA